MTWSINHREDDLDGLMEMLRQIGEQMGAGIRPSGAASRAILPAADAPGLYWDARHPKQGGTQRVAPAESAPSADHYRLVDSLDEARTYMERGEAPLLIRNLHDLDPETVEPGALRALQEQQYGAPGGTPIFVAGQGGQLMVNPEWAQKFPTSEWGR